MELYKSPVQFFEQPHLYFLDGVRLQGITSLLHSLVFPDMYPETIPPFVLARAAELGHHLHKNLQDYHEGKPITDPMPELELYKGLLKEHSWMQNVIANEYLVSDEKSVASAIDVIFQVGENSVILGDYKRTKVLQVPYLEYQLSCYATLFELANPQIKVEGLRAIHLRQEKSKSIAEVVEINRIPNDVIWSLIFSYQMGLDEFKPPMTGP